MRILYIARFLDDAGSFFVLKGLFHELRARGDVVELLDLHQERMEKRGAAADGQPAAGMDAASDAKPERPGLLRRIRKYLYTLSPGLKVFFLDGVRTLRPQLRAIEAFRPDLIVSRGNWTTVLLARFKKIAVLAHWDGLFEAEEKYGNKSFVDKRLILPVWRRIVIGNSNHFAVVSEAVRDAHLRFGRPSEDFTVLQNGVDVEVFRPDVPCHALARSLEGRIVVGFVGSFQRFHRIDEFLALLPDFRREHPSVVFVFVGSGVGWSKAASMAQDPAYASQVVFTGVIPHAEVPSAIACFDVGIIPFTAYSCSPLKMYEYMAMGKATVAPAYPPIAAVIDDGRDGLLFPPDDMQAMRAAIVRLVEDAELRESMGRRARDKMVRQFTWKHCADRFRAACEKALAQR